MTRDGNVTLFDWLDLRRRLARRLASPAPAGGALSYGPFYDPSADGAIGTPDLLMVRRNYPRGLPTTEPAVLAAPASLSSITRDVLGGGQPDSCQQRVVRPRFARPTRDERDRHQG